MKDTSNKSMKQVVKQLANIKKIEPSVSLHAKTLQKIQKQNVIPMFWVNAVACLLIVFITTEFYVASCKNETSDKDISSILSKTNNILYNE